MYWVEWYWICNRQYTHKSASWTCTHTFTHRLVGSCGLDGNLLWPVHGDVCMYVLWIYIHTCTRISLQIYPYDIGDMLVIVHFTSYDIMIQSGEDPQDALNCGSLSAKEPLILWLFCGWCSNVVWPVQGDACIYILCIYTYTHTFIQVYTYIYII